MNKIIILAISLLFFATQGFCGDYYKLGYSAKDRASIQLLAMYVAISHEEQNNRYVGLTEHEKYIQIRKDLRTMQQAAYRENLIEDKLNK